MATAASPVQSIDRVFDIIEILARYPAGLLLRDISTESNLHISTVHRLLSCLISRGYARKDSRTGKYCLTLRFFQVGCVASGALDLVALAREQLDELSDFSREAVHLVKRDGASIVYLYKAEPSQTLVRMASRVGGSNPMYCTGVGKTILAHLPESEVEEIWAQSNAYPITKNTIVTLEALKEHLVKARELGYAVDNEENEEGVFCIAAPIFNWEGRPFAAISVSAPKMRMTESAKERIVPLLLEVSQNISQQLGYTRL